MEIVPEFVSVLAQAQKIVSTGGLEQLARFAGGAAQLNPEVLDAVNFDKMMDNYAGYLGVEANVLRGQDERDRTRAARLKQQQAAQDVQSGMQAIEAIKGMGSADMDGTALGGLLGQGMAGALQ